MARALDGESYEVLTATSGSGAIELLRQDSFDLVLTDLKMPVVDGLEVLRQAREIAPQTVVVILTAYASLGSAIEALREGVHDYLVKPCSSGELKLRIERGLERVRLAEEHQRAEEELKQTMAELARSNKELEQFAYVASHDLQEPLRMVASYVQLLARHYQGKLDADADEFIAYAVDGASRMQSLINDLLAYSRVSTRGKPFEPTECEAVLSRVFADLQVVIEENGAVVTHDPLPTVMADATQLTQLFQNLIGNAIKFRSEESPRVHVSAERLPPSPAGEGWGGGEWVFAVRDNGIGVDPECHERIFLIFQRVHTREEYPGTGIGLAICKKIVECHGGRIWVESQPGKGSIFYFTIPVISDQSMSGR